MAKKKKKKGGGAALFMMAMYVLLGIAGTLTASAYTSHPSHQAGSPGGELLQTVALFLILFVSIFLQIIIHEAGHLIFGLVSGYSFCSFRVGSMMLAKEQGKLKFRRFSLAGTGGQCLMAPPETTDGRYPVMLYNFGGALINLLVSLILLIPIFIWGFESLFATICLLIALPGFTSALTNGIPMHTDLIDNDGYNALHLGKNPTAMRAFWIQLKINERIGMGERLSQMPADWFTLPEEPAKDSMSASLPIFAYLRLLDEKKFDEAALLLNEMLSNNEMLIGLHRGLLRCEELFLELIRDNRPEVVDALYQNKELQLYFKQMRSNLGVLRTRYAYEKLHLGDLQKAEKTKALFEKLAQKAPYPNDVASDRELLQIAEEKEKQI